MKTFDKKTGLKFGFLVFIAVLMMFIFINQWKNGGDDKVVEKQTVEDFNDDEVDTKRIEDIEKNYKDDGSLDNDVGKEKEVVGESEDDVGYETIDDEFDFEGQIIKKVGEKSYKDILSKSEQAMKLFTSNKKEGWEKLASTSLIEKIESGEVELLKVDKIDSLEVYPTEQFNSDDVFMGSIVAHDDTTKSYSFIFKKFEKDFLIDGIVLMWGE